MGRRPAASYWVTGECTHQDREILYLAISGARRVPPLQPFRVTVRRRDDEEPTRLAAAAAAAAATASAATAASAALYVSSTLRMDTRANNSAQ